jgi:LAS superfamily LD-carboxypeptidase LdcB
MNTLELTGRSRTHVVEVAEPACLLHREAVEPFLALRRAALRAGFDLAAASSFRDFERQLALWNAKWRGERPLLGRDGRALEASTLSPRDRVEAILSWSALPGASRHHWGTDVDLIDRAAIPAGYRVQLVPEEYAEAGIFGRLSRWLDTHLSRYGFFRPYRTPRGGVSPEPWHASYAPVAALAQSALTPDVLREALAGCGLEGEDVVLAHLGDLHARFVMATDRPPRMRSRWASARR